MRCAFCCSIILVLLSIAGDADAAEPIITPAAYIPATHSIATVTDRTAEMHQYFYVDFPRQLRALQRERELAEADLALVARRVESYRPFRSFGRYAATYTADLSWQVELLAAEHRLECVREKEIDLWRERRMAAEAVAMAAQAASATMSR
jgi:hypothetical protein